MRLCSSAVGSSAGDSCGTGHAGVPCVQGCNLAPSHTLYREGMCWKAAGASSAPSAPSSHLCLALLTAVALGAEGHTALAHDVIPLARSTGLHLGAEHPHELRLSPLQGCSPEVVWLMPRLALTPQSRSGFAVLGQDAGAGCVPLASRLPSHRAPSQRSALRPPAAGRCAALTLKAECFLFSDRMEMSHCKHPPVTLPLPAVPLTTQPRFLGSPRPQHPLVLQKQKPFASLRQKQHQC